MTDLATLELAVDSSQVRSAGTNLDGLTAASKKTQSAVEGHNASQGALSSTLKEQAQVIATLQGPLGGVASRFTSLSSLIKGVGAPLAIASVGLSALGVVADDAVKKFAALQEQQITMAAVLRATGSASGLTQDDIESLVESISRGSLSTDTQVRAAATTLLTFRGVAGDTFKQTLQLAQDLAAAGFGDVQSAALQLGRALEEPANGMETLRRVGIVFSAAQKEQVKNFLEVGNTAAAQKLILDQVSNSVGGAGAASSSGLTGATHSLSEATDELLQQWGKQITQGGLLASLLQKMADAADRMKATSSQDNTPQGHLQRLQGNMANLQSTPAALRGADYSSQLAALQAQIDAQKQLVTATQNARDQATLYASNSAYEAALARQRDAVAGVAIEIAKQTDELRKSALQQAVDLELKAAQVTAASAEGKAIADLVAARFKLQMGVQQEQARVGCFGDGARWLVKKPEKEQPEDSQRQSTEKREANECDQHCLRAAA